MLRHSWYPIALFLGVPLLGIPLLAAPPAPTIAIETPMAAPAWATLERRLLAAHTPACQEFFDKYYDSRGYLQCFLR